MLHFCINPFPPCWFTFSSLDIRSASWALTVLLHIANLILVFTLVRKFNINFFICQVLKESSFLSVTPFIHRLWNLPKCHDHSHLYIRCSEEEALQKVRQKWECEICDVQQKQVDVLSSWNKNHRLGVANLLVYFHFYPNLRQTLALVLHIENLITKASPYQK